ncbi:MAG: hypothetical protein BWY65_00527 [Firmicutes bacterium ADurb.Bin373]|nr:MAG: hypothetical protein BWY65_00527 [Firmicutes bacterium ADurb.Bin373]
MKISVLKIKMSVLPELHVFPALCFGQSFPALRPADFFRQLLLGPLLNIAGCNITVIGRYRAGNIGVPVAKPGQRFGSRVFDNPFNIGGEADFNKFNLITQVPHFICLGLDDRIQVLPDIYLSEGGAEQG